MVRDICRDTFLLSRRARAASGDDLPIVLDLRETLTANRERCVGMAANMIGQPVSVIAFYDGNRETVLLNPKIIKKSDPYETEEGCLSLSGTRPCRRYKSIKISAQDERMKPFIRTFTGLTAEIIQHEIDHLDGILI